MLILLRYSLISLAVLSTLTTAALSQKSILINSDIKNHDDTARLVDELDELVFVQDWESGAPGWQHLDGLESGENYWNLSDYNPSPGDIEDNWRCCSYPAAFSDNGGYENSWFQLIQIGNEFDLSEAFNARLTFSFSLSCQPEGTDGANVLMWADGGEFFEIIHPVLGPSYNNPSLDCFTETFMMSEILGEEIPGWSGENEFVTWQGVMFDLADYNYSDVKLYIAFCSDDSCDTRNNNGYTGLQVDNIEVVINNNTVFLNDGVVDEENPLYFSSGHPGSEHSFGIENVGDAYSGSYALSTTTSAQRVVHYWDSPQIPVPWIEEGELLLFDCLLRGEFDWLVEENGLSYNLLVKPDDMGIWYPGSSPYGQNEYFTYTGDPGPDWIRHSDLWPDNRWDATPYSGKEVNLRIVVTLPEDQPLEFTSFEIDDFYLEHIGLEHDIVATRLFMPFPTTVGTVVPANIRFRNDGWNTENGWGAYWRVENQAFSLDPPPPYEVDPGESVDLLLDSDLNDQLSGWIPAATGEQRVSAWHTMESDQRRGNDSLWVTVNVLPDGVYELGYDNRLALYPFSWPEPGTGPMMHVVPEDHGAALVGVELAVQQINFLWYYNTLEPWADEVEIVLHVFEGGETPGETIFSDTLDISWEDGMDYLNWENVDVSNVDDLQAVNSDFYIWLELLTVNEENHTVPSIVGSDRYQEINHYSIFDGSDEEASNYDFLVRVVANNTNPVSKSFGDVLPITSTLKDVYPNPCNSSAIVSFETPRQGRVLLDVFDILGRRVTQLVNRNLEEGFHSVRLNAGNFSTGLYFIHMKSADGSHIKKLLVLK